MEIAIIVLTFIALVHYGLAQETGLQIFIATMIILLVVALKTIKDDVIEIKTKIETCCHLIKNGE